MSKWLAGLVLFCCLQLPDPYRSGTAGSQATLAAAFPDTDRLFAEFAKRLGVSIEVANSYAAAMVESLTAQTPTATA